METRVAVDDKELSLIALNGLDDLNDPFVIVETLRVEDVNFASFVGLLRTYEACRQWLAENRVLPLTTMCNLGTLRLRSSSFKSMEKRDIPRLTALINIMSCVFLLNMINKGIVITTRDRDHPTHHQLTQSSI